MLNRGIGIVAACALAAVATLAAAQTYPTKPVRIMVGAGAGGGTDIIARMLAEKYQGVFGQPFVVENKPGASNTIAADLTAKAAPDGHTLLLATNTGQAIAPHLIKLGFDTNKDLIPVALIVVVPNVLASRTPARCATRSRSRAGWARRAKQRGRRGWWPAATAPSTSPSRGTGASAAPWSPARMHTQGATASARSTPTRRRTRRPGGPRQDPPAR